MGITNKESKVLKYIIDHNTISYAVDISLTLEEELHELAALNHRWQKLLLGNDTSKGFLSAAFTVDTFRTLAEKNEIVIGSLNERIVSYYLINSVSRDGILIKHGSIVKTLKDKQVIASGSRVALGAQALVDSNFQGSILRKLMLNELVKLNTISYEYFFSTISRENLRAFHAHAKDGWEVVSEDVDTFHTLLDLSKQTI